MSDTIVYGEVTAAIPLPNGHTRYQKVGVVLQHEKNDINKGPGFSIMLDRTFNPAGMPGHGSSVALSVYWPKPKDTPRVASPGQGPDDDIPF